MRRIIAVLLLFCCYSFAAKGGGHGSHSSHSSKSHSAKASKSKSSKTVHVREYQRKDGTVVHAHDRNAPGTAESSVATPFQPYKTGHLAEGKGYHPSVSYDKHGKIKRSRAARDSFMREHPCPSTGRTSGSCPGFVVDHVRPLECGGADAPFNMQWQTVAAGKEKDKTERYCR